MDKLAADSLGEKERATPSVGEADSSLNEGDEETGKRRNSSSTAEAVPILHRRSFFRGAESIRIKLFEIIQSIIESHCGGFF